MDQVKANLINTEFQALMADFAKKHKLTVRAKGTFDSAGIKFTAQFADTAVTGGQEFDPTLVAHLRKWGHNWNLNVEMLGTEIASERGPLIFHGTRGTSTKYLIMALKQSGSKYRFDINGTEGRLFTKRIIEAHAAK